MNSILSFASHLSNAPFLPDSEIGPTSHPSAGFSRGFFEIQSCSRFLRSYWNSFLPERNPSPWIRESLPARMFRTSGRLNRGLSRTWGLFLPETEIVAPLRLLVSGSSPGFLVSPLMSGRTEERTAFPPYSGQKVQGFPVGRPLENKGAGMANDSSRDRKDSPSDSPQRPGPAGGRKKIPPEADEQRFPGREDPAPRPLPQSLSLWCARSPFLHVLDQPNSPII